MTLTEFLKLMDSQTAIWPGSDAAEMMQDLSRRARWITNYLNCVAHEPGIVRKIMAELLKAPVDETVTVLPPFYSDCGKNLHLGKRILIQQACCFQDQGGIHIADDCVIDQDVVVCTLARDMDPQKRDVLHPQPVVLEKSVWLGAHCTILPGVRICEGSVVMPGSVVMEDVSRGIVVGGAPAAYIRDI